MILICLFVPVSFVRHHAVLVVENLQKKTQNFRQEIKEKTNNEGNYSNNCYIVQLEFLDLMTYLHDLVLMYFFSFIIKQSV
jgi:hypothetical protein